MVDMLNTFVSNISGPTVGVLDENNRLLVTACPDSLADGGIVTLQSRMLLSVLQVMASGAPGHTKATSEGDSINLDSTSSLDDQSRN